MSSLPFGQTQTTVSEIKSLVDRDTAVEQAEDGEVDNPEERVDKFLRSIPALLNWLDTHGRHYPWRESTDPWEVYIAEILLQRTRGDAVAGVYPEFIKRFPDPESLEKADEDEIRDLIRTLGFVNHRTKTLTDMAGLFTEHYDGRVPESLQALKEPWRVGEYSARACQIFARGEVMALVDANFARVIGRVLGYKMPSQPHKSDAVYRLLDALIPTDPELARAFNLAVLDLGALVCTPDSPTCSECPLQQACHYYQTKRNSA
jgi:A/G-specific adenine glycosylase